VINKFDQLKKKRDIDPKFKRIIPDEVRDGYRPSLNYDIYVELLAV